MFFAFSQQNHYAERPFFISLDHSACGVQSSALSFLPESVFIRAASHGLLCCQSIFTHNPRYYICNPATKEWKKLPKPKFYHWQNSAAVALNFHPSVFNFKANFELVCAVAVPENHVVCFEIYSSRSGSWRISGTECYEEDALKLKGDGFCLNGVAFWETCCGTILAFYLSDEEYDGLRIDIHGGWDMSFKYRISLDSSTPSQTNGELRVLPCVNGEVVMVISKRGFLGAYKVKDRKMKLSGISYGHDNSITSDEYVKCLPYVNSLVSVGSQIVESQDFYH
uniref:F-box protein At3g26010-like beta-propeller domain-containing protein n=1 Tax=Cannabis sativa TaxID=3483 RepID=A0A803PFC1_CANSA